MNSSYKLLDIGHQTWADSRPIVRGHLQCMKCELFGGDGIRGEITYKNDGRLNIKISVVMQNYSKLHYPALM